jgi:hypothetical protein
MAVILGTVSGGLACRDFDTMAEYNRWAEKHPELAEKLPTVETSRGRHIYFINSGLEGIKHTADGELRLSGGYCLLPPSLHPSGIAYRWLIPLNGNLIKLDPEKSGFVPDNYTLHTVHTLHTKQYKEVRKEKSTIIDCVLEDDLVKKSIFETLPEKFGQRNRKIFAFALKLKTNIIFRDKDPKTLKDIVHQWFKAALPNISTKDFLETWLDFLNAWEKIFFLGVDYMAAYQTSLYLEPSKSLLENYPDWKELIALEAFCRALDQACNGSGFVHDCRKAGEIIGVSFKTANIYLRLLCKIGVLELLKKGKFSNNPAERKANKYRYIAN